MSSELAEVLRDILQEEMASWIPMFDPEVTGHGGLTLLDCIIRNAAEREREKEAEDFQSSASCSEESSASCSEESSASCSEESSASCSEESSASCSEESSASCSEESSASCSEESSASCSEESSASCSEESSASCGEESATSCSEESSTSCSEESSASCSEESSASCGEESSASCSEESSASCSEESSASCGEESSASCSEESSASCGEESDLSPSSEENNFSPSSKQHSARESSVENFSESTTTNESYESFPVPSRKRKRREEDGNKYSDNCGEVSSSHHLYASKRRRSSYLPSNGAAAEEAKESTSNDGDQRSPKNVVALDCEVVSCHPSLSANRKKKEVLVAAHCAIVDYDGEVLYDSYICPDEPVVDYRSISKSKVDNGTPFKKATEEIVGILKDKKVIIHDATKDLDYLKFNELYLIWIGAWRGIRWSIRDTSTCSLLKKRAEDAGISVGCPNASLKDLAKGVLKKNVQKKKPHNPVHDACTAMELYRCVEKEWENKYLSKETTKSTAAVESESSSSNPSCSETDSDSECHVSD